MHAILMPGQPFCIKRVMPAYRLRSKKHSGSGYTRFHDLKAWSYAP